MLRPGERTLRNGKEVKVVVPQDEYAKHLSLRHVNQKKINECVAVLLKDMCKFWDGGLPLPFLGAAFLAPFLDWKFQQKMRPYYWITGTHQSGKSHFLTYLMRLFGSGWQDTSLPGIAGTTNSWLAPGKFYRYAVCPLDDCKTSLFRNASERNAFISMLHQYTMSRGRTRSDRDGQVSEALSTGIRGTLVCTSESDISDFGSKGQEGAITSRGVRISVDRIPLEKRRMQVEALEEVSPDFSAITTDIIRFVQVTNYDLQISVAACADKLRKTLADNQVQSDVVGRQVDMWSYCLAGWKLFADWCRANSEKKHVVANTMYLECIAVACRSILAEQEDIPNEGEWHVFLRTLDRLLMENKAVILKGNDVSPGHVAAIETASPSAEVIGLLTSENLYLYPENISDQAERHYHCRLNLKMAGRELANVRVVVGKTGRSLLIRTAGRKNAAIRHKLFINNRQTAMTIWKLDLLAYRGAMETL